MEQLAAQLNVLAVEVTTLQTINERKEAETKDLKRKLEKANYYLAHPHAPRTPPPETENPKPKPKPTTQEGIMAAILKAFLTKEKKIRLPKPHDWDGDRKGLDTFFRECEAWLKDRNMTDDTDDLERRKQIMIIVGHMKDTPSQWVTTQMKIHGVHVEEIWPTRATFWKELRERFGDSDPHFSARTCLAKLRQGDKSVHTYNLWFNEHAGLTGYNETALVSQYFTGLNPKITEGIFQRDNIPTNLKGTQTAAIRVENLKNQLAFLTSGSKWKDSTNNNPAPTTPWGRQPPTKPRPANPTPSVRTEGPGTTGPMDIDRARREGVCRHCGEQYMPGHYCAAKKAAQDAYRVRNRALESSGEASKDADFDRNAAGTSQALVKKDKGKEKAKDPNQDIGGTLAAMMDAINMLTKRIDSLNG